MIFSDAEITHHSLRILHRAQKLEPMKEWVLNHYLFNDENIPPLLLSQSQPLLGSLPASPYRLYLLQESLRVLDNLETISLECHLNLRKLAADKALEKLAQQLRALETGMLFLRWNIPLVTLPNSVSSLQATVKRKQLGPDLIESLEAVLRDYRLYLAMPLTKEITETIENELQVLATVINGLVS